MTHLDRLTGLFPSPHDVSSLARSLPSTTYTGVVDAAYFTSKTAKQSYEKTTQGIRSARDFFKLAKAVIKTVSGWGDIIHTHGYEPTAPPKNWNEQKVIAGGHETTITHMPTPNAIGTYIFAMGHGSECTFYKPWIDRIQKRGFNVITIELPEPENNDYYANGDRIDDGYEKIIADTVLNPNSAVYQNIPAWHTVSLLTHSASGRGFESAISKDDQKVAFAKKMFGDRIFHSGIMLETAHSSLKHAWLFSKGYDWYSQRKHVRGQKAGTTAVDRLWIREELDVSQEKYAKVDTRANVTHGQAYALKHGGIDLVQSAENPHKLTTAFRQLKRTIIMGLDETSACPLTAKDYADSVDGISFVGIAGVKHNPLMECAEAYKLIAKRTIPQARRHFNTLKDQATAVVFASPASAPQAF